MEEENPNSPQARARRKDALCKMRLVLLGQVLIGGGLVGCGVLGSQHDESSKHGPPYYTGALIAGGVMLLASLTTGRILKNDFSSADSLTEVQCMFTCDFTLTFLNILGTVQIFVFILMSDILSSSCGLNPCKDTENRRFNTTIAKWMIGLGVCQFVAQIFNICMILNVMNSFGLSDRGTGRHAMVTPQMAIAMGTYHANMLQATAAQGSRFPGPHVPYQSPHMPLQQFPHPPGIYPTAPPPPPPPSYRSGF